VLGEACDAPVKAAAELPPKLHQLLEKVASTVGTAGMDNGWRVVQFGSRGFNADLTVGTNVVKVTTEGTPAADGSGAILRLKRPGLDRTFVSRMGSMGDLELADDKGAAVPLPALVEVLKVACRY
jgi:hypothetical protein